jgi:hypothetical protein
LNGFLLSILLPLSRASCSTDASVSPGLSILDSELTTHNSQLTTHRSPPAYKVPLPLHPANPTS